MVPREEESQHDKEVTGHDEDEKALYDRAHEVQLTVVDLDLIR